MEPKEVAKQLKKTLSQILNRKDLRVRSSFGKSTYIEIWIPYKSEPLANSLRRTVIETTMPGAATLNWDNIHYGNVQDTRICLIMSDWIKVLEALNTNT